LPQLGPIPQRPWAPLLLCFFRGGNLEGAFDCVNNEKALRPPTPMDPFFRIYSSFLFRPTHFPTLGSFLSQRRGLRVVSVGAQPANPRGGGPSFLSQKYLRRGTAILENFVDAFGSLSGDFWERPRNTDYFLSNFFLEQVKFLSPPDEGGPPWEFRKKNPKHAPKIFVRDLPFALNFPPFPPRKNQFPVSQRPL